MNPPQQCEVHFPANASAAADAPWSATAFPAPAPQHPLPTESTPSSYRRPIPAQPPRPHASVVPDAVFPQANTAGNHRVDEDWEHMPPLVEYTAARGRAQDLRHGDMANYVVADDHPPLREHHGHAINNYAGVALGVPAQAQVAPPAPEEIDMFNDPAQQAAAGPAQAFLNERPHRGPVPNGLANEVLRQLAVLYLNEPNSQVAMLYMEPSHAHGVRVVITLELAGL